MKEIWFVRFPTHQFCEDVKAIAKRRGLKIVDERFRNGVDQCKDAPSLTPCEGVDSEMATTIGDGLSEDENPLKSTLDDLKEEADKLGIPYRNNIGFDTLFERVQEAKG